MVPYTEKTSTVFALRNSAYCDTIRINVTNILAIRTAFVSASVASSCSRAVKYKNFKYLANTQKPYIQNLRTSVASSATHRKH